MTKNKVDKNELADLALVRYKENKYDLLTQRLKAALSKIRDENLPATQKVLIQLADCHRRTLNTSKRSWTIVELNAIRTERQKKKEAGQEQHAATSETGIAFHKKRNRKLVAYMRKLMAGQLEQADALGLLKGEIARLLTANTELQKNIIELKRRR